jgi:hypothetical protein
MEHRLDGHLSKGADSQLRLEGQAKSIAHTREKVDMYEKRDP